ncbi:MAG TPA: hypothetical protein VFF26_11290 [Gallionella sp.]|nr:hypothetical protein [Gallionella sp.]
MDEEDICVDWRAAILLDNGRRVVHGRLRRLGRGKAVVRADCNLKPGYRCNLALMLPKSRPEEPDRIVEGRGVVAYSVMSSMQFHITLERLELDGRGNEMVDEHIRLHGKVWKRPQ